ncbi:hypothetical protein ROS217_14831 [Roseovarius sp. 217]|nr:hypothetical protein ROS217_14831 [Roseovarius sp. 217]
MRESKKSMLPKSARAALTSFAPGSGESGAASSAPDMGAAALAVRSSESDGGGSGLPARRWSYTRAPLDPDRWRDGRQDSLEMMRGGAILGTQRQDGAIDPIASARPVEIAQHPAPDRSPHLRRGTNRTLDARALFLDGGPYGLQRAAAVASV